MTFFNDQDDRELTRPLLFAMKVVCLLLAAAIAVIVVMHFADPAAARDYCYRPGGPLMMGTNENCNRVPTIQKPYCPMP